MRRRFAGVCSPVFGCGGREMSEAGRRASVRVKICGITRLEDAEWAVACGADAIGLVFYPPSPRSVSAAQARDIALAAGPFTTVVGLFVDAARADIEAVLEQVPLHLLQFHGSEPAADCRRYGRPYLKALRMKPGLEVVPAIQAYPDAAGILLDAYRKGVPGGTGEAFDWQRVPRLAPRPLVLAGGLNPANVAAAVAATGVVAVDVSGGVEAGAGIKDRERVADFIRNAREAGQDLVEKSSE